MNPRRCAGARCYRATARSSRHSEEALAPRARPLVPSFLQCLKPLGAHLLWRVRLVAERTERRFRLLHQ
jgi:hypothetical protein